MAKNRIVSACQTGVLALAVLLAMLPLGGRLALGQAQNTGTIYGTVTDPTGAVLANAQVTASEAEKGITRSVTSSKNGDFQLPSLPVGTYTVTVVAIGFEAYVADTVNLDADRSVKLVVKLTVGSAKDTVQVDANGTALDTNSATLGTTIDNKLVEELPIDGRNVVALAALLPGVTDLNAPATNTGDRNGPTFSVSGSRNTQNLFLFDGLMWNNLFFNTGINYPPPNSLQEISVLLNNFKAQYGRNAGSVFNVVTKSGTNGFHGALWDYVQSALFNATDYITKENPTDNSNQAGFTLEGPLKRDKLFFALTFQDLIQHLQAVGITTTQTYANRGYTDNFSGDLTTNPAPNRPCTAGVYAPGATCASFLSDVQPLTPNGKYLKFYNPEIYTSTSGLQEQPSNALAMFESAYVQAGNPDPGPGNTPCDQALKQAAAVASRANPPYQYFNVGEQASYLPNAEIPSVCLNPVIQNILNQNVGVPTIVSANGQFNNISKRGQPKDDKNVLARIDWIANAQHHVDARYDLIDADDSTAPGVNSASLGIATFAPQANHAVSNYGNISDTWVVSPNIVNTFRIGYKRYQLATPPLDHRTLAYYGGNLIEPGTPAPPVIDFGGQSDYTLGLAGAGGASNQSFSSVINENIEILEQASYTHGSHSFQAGVNFLRLQYDNQQQYPGKINFSTDFTGYPDADGAFGLVNQVNANSPLSQAGISHNVYAYLQDDWRATSKLTFNLGARYELPFQWYQPTGFASTFIPGHQSTVFPGAIGGLAFPGDKGVLKSLVPTDFNGFAPRFGFAYDVFGTGILAIRGGFGMFFDAVSADVVGVGEPFYFQLQENLPPGGASVPLATYGPGGSIYKVPSGYNKANPQFLAPYSLFYPDRNFRTPYYEAFNLGFELRVTKGGVLDTNYVGKLGRKQTIPVDQNPAIYDCSGGYYQADPGLYCTGATSQVTSTKARLRYTPFNYGGVGLVDFMSAGTSNYNGLQVQYTQRHGKLLTLLMSYTYAKAIDLQTQSTQLESLVPDVFNINSERGVSDFDVKHVLNMGWLLTLPKVTDGNLVERTVLNDWSFGGIFLAHTGRPYSVTINNDSALDGETHQRAAFVPGISPVLPSDRHRAAKVKEYFNVNAFTYPTPGTFSPQQRNSYFGPGYLLTDFTLQRYFPLTHIHEGMRMLFRADAFNVFNTPNLANPYSQFSCSTTSTAGGSCSAVAGNSVNKHFGVVQSTYGNNANTSTNGRKMQLAMTVYF
jgi:outer membrane receptor protein involved in Fe transport